MSAQEVPTCTLSAREITLLVQKVLSKCISCCCLKILQCQRKKSVTGGRDACDKFQRYLYVRINFGLNLQILSHKCTILVLFNEKHFLQLLLNIRVAKSPKEKIL